MNEQELLEIIEDRKQELFGLLSSLIKIDSQNFSSYGNEIEIADFIGDYCRSLGLETKVYSPIEVPGLRESDDYFPGRTLETRRCVTSVLKGREDRNGLMLMAHLDTVAVGDPANWRKDPFCGEIENGKIYGRGACDDKYGLATIMFLLKIFREKGFVPRTNLVFGAYGDEEEGGSHGAMACCMTTPSERIVNLDGSRFNYWTAASGGGDIEIDFHEEGNISSASGVARMLPYVLDCIDSFGRDRDAELAANPKFGDVSGGGYGLMYLDIHLGNNGMDLERGRVKFEYFTDRTREEMDKALDKTVERINEKLRPLGGVCDSWKRVTRHFHYKYSNPDGDSVKEMKAAAARVSGRELIPSGSALSDLSVILKYGSQDAFGLGIGGGFSDEGGSHQNNEALSCDEFLEFAKIIAAYTLNYLK